MQKYRLLLLGLIVIGTLLSSFHYHGDGLVHSDCQVCTIQSNLDSASEIESYSLASIYTNIDLFISFYTTPYTVDIYSYTHSRAPPSFS